MDAKARLGRWVLVAVFVVTAGMEVALAVWSDQMGRYRPTKQLVRVSLTVWLFWQVWDGAAWARWLVAGLYLAAGVGSAVFAAASPAIEGRPEVAALFFAVAAVFVVLALGLASPWAAAYQAARRGPTNTDAA